MLKIFQKQDECKKKCLLFRKFGKTSSKFIAKKSCQESRILLIMKGIACKSFNWNNFPRSLMKSSVITQQSHNVVKTQRQWRNFEQPIHSVVTTLMSQRQNYNVASTSSTLFQIHNIPLMKRCCNIEITTSVSQRLLNVDTTKSNLECSANVASTLDRKFTSQYIMDVVMTTSVQRWNYDVKFTTFYDAAPTLPQHYKEPQMQTCNLLQSCK